jgi:type I restriction enzyme S subunit
MTIFGPYAPPTFSSRNGVAQRFAKACSARQESRSSSMDWNAARARASPARFAEAPNPANLNDLFHQAYTIPPADLRKSILTLAVQGKLVPQDPNDEPAEEGLARIAATKLRLQKTGEIGKEKPVEPLQPDSLPFEAPDSWRWAKLAELTELITKGSSPKWQGIAYVSESEGILFITSENVGNYVLRKLDDLKYVSKGFNEIEPRSILKRGDILMNLVGASIGRTAVYDLHDGANINQAVALIRLVRETDGICPRFLLNYLNSPAAINNMLSSRVVNALPNISLTDAREFAVPIPPLAEQRRIVAKVEQLMALVDALEQQLAASRSTAAKLLTALVTELTTA